MDIHSIDKSEAIWMMNNHPEFKRYVKDFKEI